MRKAAPARHSFVERVIGVLSLREEMIREVVDDATANQQALRALFIGSLGPAIGALFWGGVLAIPFYFVLNLVLWTLVAPAVYFLATRLFEAGSTIRSPIPFARGVAFAGLPRLVLAAGFNEIIFGVLAGITLLWSIAAMILSMRASLNLSPGRAAASASVGVILVFVVSSIVVQTATAIA
jgi:hypothetical protein